MPGQKRAGSLQVEISLYNIEMSFNQQLQLISLTENI